MKIALVHYSMLPVIGGVEQVLGAHARLFAEHGHEVARISFFGEAEARLDAGAPAAELRERLRPLLSPMDVVFAHNVMTMPFHAGLAEALGELAVELRSTRFLAWVHDIAAANPDLAPVPPLTAARGFQYVAVSRLRARQFHDLTGVKPRMVPNGIDPPGVLGIPPGLAELAEQWGLFAGAPVLLHPTRLLRRKNVELGLRVINHLEETKAMLLITGAADPHNEASREYGRWLRAERDRRGLKRRVIFVSDYLTVGDEELAALYRLADALFLPSRQEGFGLPVLEAALHRLPAFLSDIEAFTEIAPTTCRRFSIEADAAEVARLVSDTLKMDETWKAKTRALEWRWARIYEMHLEPLLSGN